MAERYERLDKMAAIGYSHWSDVDGLCWRVEQESMAIRQLIEEKRDDILHIAAKHGAHNIRVFGSVARGDDRPDSDVDLLVDVETTTSSWFPAGLILDLQQILGRPVEIVTEKGLNPLIKERVLREAIPL